MSWYWHFGHRGLKPYTGVTREADVDSLIERLMRHGDPDPAAPRVMPDALAGEIKRKLDEHAASSANTVVSGIGSGFEAGDRAEITLNHGGLQFRIKVEALGYQNDDDDFDFDLDDDETEEASQ